MRLCLVEQHWERVNICNTSEESWTGVGVKRMCVTMAEDEGYVLVFDPVDEQVPFSVTQRKRLGHLGNSWRWSRAFHRSVVDSKSLKRVPFDNERTGPLHDNPATRTQWSNRAYPAETFTWHQSQFGKT